jgi:restriction endonuclease S subunit
METATKTYLQFVAFHNFALWDVKRYTRKTLSSRFNQVALIQCIKEENKRYKIFEKKEVEFGILGINNKEGIFDAYIQKGKEINQPYKKMETGWLAYNPYRINVGSIGIKKAEHKNDYISPAYVIFSCRDNLLPEYLYLIFKTDSFNKVINESTTGSVRQSLTFDTLKNIPIPLPSLEEQTRIMANYNANIRQAEKQEQQANDLEKRIEKYLFEALGIEKKKKKNATKKLTFINSSLIEEWGINKILGQNQYLSSKYDNHSFASNLTLFQEIFRGKSPKYSDNSNSIILNQKCNRWNNIEISYAKSVDKDWIKSLNKNHFTQIGDILINSTGEGTIGRASTIKEGFNNLMYDSHILLLRVNPKLIYPDYFTILFNSSYGQQQVDSLKSAQSTKQTELGVGNLQKIKFPLLQLDRQKEIVNHIQNMRKEIRNFQHVAEDNRNRAIKEFEKEIFE